MSQLLGSFQLLHAVHAVELFLKKLQDQGCNFHIVLTYTILYHVLTQMEVIQHANLEASLKEDYILASFPANYGYVVPKEWNSMNIASLSDRHTSASI